MLNLSNSRGSGSFNPYITLFYRLSAGLGSFALLIAGLTVLGWVGHFEHLKAWVIGPVSMHLSVAAGLAVSGSSLIVKVSKGSALQRRVVFASGGLILALGLLGILTSASGTELLVDNGGLCSELTRMAPVSAAAFVAIGLTFLLSDGANWAKALSQGLAVSVTLFGMIGLLGYLYGNDGIYAVAGFSSIACNTAAGFVVVGLGSLFSRPEFGLMRTIASAGPGGTVSRKAIPLGIVIPFAVGWLRLRGQNLGLYGTEFGLAIFAAANISFFVLLIWWSATLVERAEHERVTIAAAQQSLQIKSRQAFAELAESTAKFKHLVQSVHDYAISMLDLDGRIVSWNAGAERLLGYQDQEILGRHFSTFYPSEERAIKKPQEILSQARKIGRYEDQAVHVRKDGTRFWATVIINATQDDRGSLNGFAKITRDITAWKEAQDRLSTSEERLRSIVNNIVDGIVTIDDLGKIQSINPAAEMTFGYTSDELSGQGIGVLMPEPYRSLPDDRITDYLTNEVPKFLGVCREVEGRRRDGTTFPMELAVGEFHQNQQRLFTGVVRDVTQRKATELLAMQQNRRDQEALESRVAERTKQLSSTNLALQGTVAELKESREQLRQLSKRFHSLQEKERARIAHEIHDELGQMLAVMKIELFRMKNRATQLPELVEQARVLMETVDLTISMLRRISSDLRPVVLEQLGLVAALEWLVSDISKRTGVVCSLVTTGAIELNDSEVNTGLFRIVQEAITNALKHSGTTKIDVSLVKLASSLIVTVRDYGCGIRLEDRNKSSSLGLTGMRERALAIDATLEVKQASPLGTLVMIELPFT